MTLSVKEVLAAKGISPKPETVEKLESKWAEIQELKGNFKLADEDIAVRNIPGGDHVG